MNSNQTRTLWIAIGAAVFAMFLIYSYSQEKKAEYDKKYGSTKRVVVATKDILEMSTIDDTMIEIIEKPIDFIQPGALEDPEDAVGLVAAAPIKKGEEVLTTKLLAPGPNTGLSLQISPGNRAVTIPITDVSGVAKLIRPGDHIDIITALQVGSGNNRKTEVKTLLQDVPVLAAGVHITNHIPRALEVSEDGKTAHFRNLRGDLSFTTITIETSPNLAQDLIYIMAANPGSIYTVLRNPNDKSSIRLPISNETSVLGRRAFNQPRQPSSFPNRR